MRSGIGPPTGQKGDLRWTRLGECQSGGSDQGRDNEAKLGHEMVVMSSLRQLEVTPLRSWTDEGLARAPPSAHDRV